MGREIRRVPPNWDHPRTERHGRISYKAMYDKCAEDAWNEWQAEYQAWLDGEHDQIIQEYGDAEYPKDQPYASFCKWHGEPPDPEYYRPKWDEATATWWQVYETVSEGTPVSPPFATPEELIEYLVEHGDFWDQARRKEGEGILNCRPWPRQQAESFVKRGWAPSLIMDGKGVRSGVVAMAEMDATKPPAEAPGE